MMYPPVVVQGRNIKPVSGRVLVNTNSVFVEYLNKSKTQSLSLYTVNNLGAGKLYSFMIEIDGFLTFDPDCYVNISEEFNPFQQLYFDPLAAGQVMRASSPAFIPYVQSTSYSGSRFGPLAPGTSTPMVNYAQITVCVEFAVFTTYVFRSPTLLTPNQMSTLVTANWPANSLFKGGAGYPPFILEDKAF
jgi:hypothetical protein